MNKLKYEDSDFEDSGVRPQGSYEFEDDEFESDEDYEFEDDEFEDDPPPGNRKMLAIGAAIAAVAVIVLLVVFGGKLGGPKVPGKEIRAQYASIDEGNWKARNDLILQQVADGNMPSDWDDFVPVQAKSPKGTVVEFYVAKHPLRVGTDDDWTEIAVDGPHAAAICEITGYSLPHYWMVDYIHVQARETGGVVHFYATCEIARALQVPCPNGSSSKKEFILKRDELLHAWMEKKGIKSDQLVSGYYKDVVLPVDGRTRGPQERTFKDRLMHRTRVKSGRVEIYGGYNDAGNRIQPLSGGHHIKGFFDYPQNLRFVKKEVKVNGESMSLADFVGNAELASEFGFSPTTIREPIYPLSDELKKFVEEHK